MESQLNKCFLFIETLIYERNRTYKKILLKIFKYIVHLLILYMDLCSPFTLNQIIYSKKAFGHCNFPALADDKCLTCQINLTDDIYIYIYFFFFFFEEIGEEF